MSRGRSSSAARSLLVPSCVAGLAALVVRWRRSDGLVRRQVAVLLVTAAVLVVDTLLQPLLAWPVGALTPGGGGRVGAGWASASR